MFNKEKRLLYKARKLQRKIDLIKVKKEFVLNEVKLIKTNKIEKAEIEVK